MTYQQMFKKVQKLMKDVDASFIKEHVAFQFNVEGDGEGIFYAEVSEGTLYIEPYDYIDHNAVFIATADTFSEILGGKKDPVEAFQSGELKIEGDLEKALLLKELISSKKVTKATTAKKTTTKKTTAAPAKKTTTAAAAKKTTTAAAAKKTTTADPVAKAAAAKKTTTTAAAKKTTTAEPVVKTTTAKTTSTKTTK